MMAGVSRREAWAVGPQAIPGYLFHGSTAIVVLFLLFKAIGA